MSNETAPIEPVWLFPVTDLKQWAYCPRIVWYRYCLPQVRPQTALMRAGTEAHAEAATREERRSLRPYGLTTGERHPDVAVQSVRLCLTGRIDLVIRVAAAEAVIVDYKLSEREAVANYHLQLAAYALLIEEAWSVTVRRGFLYHIEERRAEAVTITPTLRRKVRATVAALQAAVAGETFPAPPANLGKCVACEFRRFCNDVV